MERVAVTDEAWTAYVRSHPSTTPFHDPVWAELLASTYRMEVFALVRSDSTGRIVAGLPVAVAPRLPRRPRRLVALPFTDALAPLTTGPADDLAVEIDAFRERSGNDEVEVRAALGTGAHEIQVGYRHLLALEPDAEAVLKRLSEARRRNLRTAERHGIAVRSAVEARDLTEVFYGLHVETRRRLGVPVQPKRFFRALWERVVEPGGGFVLVAEEAGDPVAAAVFLTGNGQLVYKFSASNADKLAHRPNDLLIWTAIRIGCERGLECLDFGRTDLGHRGLREFKQRWGTVEEPLVYSTVGGAAGAERSAAPGALAGVLRKAPTVATRIVGELLYRYAA